MVSLGEITRDGEFPRMLDLLHAPKNTTSARPDPRCRRHILPLKGAIPDGHSSSVLATRQGGRWLTVETIRTSFRLE